MPSDLWRHQAYVWCTDLNAGKTLTQKMSTSNSIKEKKLGYLTLNKETGRWNFFLFLRLSWSLRCHDLFCFRLFWIYNVRHKFSEISFTYLVVLGYQSDSRKSGRVAHKRSSESSNTPRAALPKCDLVMVTLTCGSAGQLGILGHSKVLLRIKPLLRICCLMFAWGHFLLASL